jgi:acyl carrier protein
MINAYGPTENAAYTTCHVMTDPSDVPDRVPIGRPVSGTTVYVLDASLRPVPVGVPGELWTGGDGLAVGYVGDEVATRAAFVNGPFELVPADRLYRTGDRARWRPDGSLQFLGRSDRQAKVRGFRVEPGEVEAALLALPGIGDSAVLVAGDTPDSRRLVAFAVAADGEAVLPVDEVKAHLAQRLPHYLVPSTVRQVPRLPLLRNGKLDRKKLLLELQEPGMPVGGDVAPRTEFEAALVPIWAQILGVESVSVTADFFADLGGHSLLGTRLVARVRDAFDIELPLRTLFDSPTIAGMALAVESLLLEEMERDEAVLESARQAGDR